MNVKKRVKEKIFGIAFAIIFVIFAVLSCRVAVHSSDTEDYDVRYFNREYGYDRIGFLRDRGRIEEADEAQTDWDDTFRAIEEREAAAAAQELAGQQAAVQAAVVAEPTPAPLDPNSPAARAMAKGLSAPPEINAGDWQYVLVNTAHELESTFEPPQLAYLNMTADDTDIRFDYDPNRQMVDSRIAQALVDFAQGCKNAGLPVYLSSGYRSYTEQQYLFNRKLNQGYSYDVAKTIVAYPGTSEHQTGLCCDITDYYHELKDDSLENTETFKWLNDHCAEYGFILRYPKEKSGGADTVTGCIYEPWHFRYVGPEAARYIKDNNLCLEEFMELYE